MLTNPNNPENYFSDTDLACAETVMRAQALLSALLGEVSTVQSEAPVLTTICDAVTAPEQPLAMLEEPPQTVENTNNQSVKIAATKIKVGVIAVKQTKTAIPEQTRSYSLSSNTNWLETLTDETKLSYDESISSLVLAAPIAEGADWEVDALCAQVDPEIFFPEKGGSTREAKKICTSCLVRAQCLEAAITRDERFGIWGGYSERERRRLKRQSETNVFRTEHELAASLKQHAYGRTKDLVDALGGNDDNERVLIEDALHEDEVRLTKFVQATLGCYERSSSQQVPKKELGRLFAYFTGVKLWDICSTPAVAARLAREIDALYGFLDEETDDESSLLEQIWRVSAVSDTEGLNVMNHIMPKPKWQKKAMRADSEAVSQ